VNTLKKIPAVVIALLLSQSGCVSVQLGGSKAKKSDNISVDTPDSPFVQISDSNSDQTWQNQKTGNTISYLSECPQPEASLEAIAAEFNLALGSIEGLKKEKTFFAGREALRSNATGQIDGIKMQLYSIVVKKNGCSYVLTYVGRSDRFEQDYRAYEHFLSRVRIQ
jgi:hypothetical protein